MLRLEKNRLTSFHLQETMITKGVASVRSPVCNLQQHDASVSHERFVRAVELAFRGEYDIDVDEEVGYPPSDRGAWLTGMCHCRCSTYGRMNRLSASRISQKGWRSFRPVPPFEYDTLRGR